MSNYYKPYSYKEISRDSSEAIPLALVKEHIRASQDNSTEDELIRSYMATARLCFEGFTRRTLITTTYKTYRDIWQSGYEIRRSPLQTIESVKYYDTDNVLQTLDSSNYYITNETDYSRLIFNNDAVLPSLKNREQAIEITFKAGYGDAMEDIPYDIRVALLQHIASMYENRGDCIDSVCSNLLPATASMIYSKYKIIEMVTYFNR